MKENNNTLAKVECKIENAQHSQNEGEIVLYQPNENIKLDVLVDANRDTVWLNQAQMATLYGTKRQAITKHIRNIYEDQELTIDSTCSILELVQKEGRRLVKRKVEFYNLDMIISVGFRVNTKLGIQFRKWATTVLREHLLKGYTINHHLVALQQNVDSRFESLENRVGVQEQQVAFLVNMHQQPSEQIFASGCTWDAWTCVSELVRKASHRIALIDNYVDERTLLMLDKRQEGVACAVYTRVSKQVKLDVAKHNEQNSPIEVLAMQHKVHDRYLIVDQQVWLLGASVKDMGKGLCTVIELGFSPDEVLGKVETV